MRYLVPFLLLACSPSVARDDSPKFASSEVPITEYDRKEWGYWRDEDGDCQDTRQEVLIAESLIPVTFTDEKECRVATGEWQCPLSGEKFTNPSDLDIDHMVPLKAAFDAGGFGWNKDKKSAYFNFLEAPEHLLATSASANRSKGSRSPMEWMPPKEDYRCEYLKNWVKIKRRWDLNLDSSAIIDLMVENCK
jgi:hypothetical protein